MGFSTTHLLLLLVVVVLLFGRGKISELMGDVARGIKSFKKGMAEDETAGEAPRPQKAIDHAGTPAGQSERDTTKTG
ncbi:MAG TPA: twin-arginine translocase TatA/TatE family subunit [Hyphomicrobiaceae bacterium]|nr:twin-arginine translocase TatA/TatE family subunit [Hyphomicrobiaceae bacterium]